MQNVFKKSDMGAQAAWKGFSSQTLYIASRLINDEDGYEYYPEDVEDLVVRKNGAVIEGVQIKNLSADLTISKLASTKTSKRGGGFFNRMCVLHSQNPSFSCIRIVYFGALGSELLQVQNGNVAVKKSLENKLVNDHGLTQADAVWVIESLIFEKANIADLGESILTQISSYVPVMAAPSLAKDLLVQHISNLSKSKGYTTLHMWREKIHEIGASVAAIDGFYKEYNKSLVRLTELQSNNSEEQLKQEYSQGVSAHPAHIRNNLDFERHYWIGEIRTVIKDKGVAILKGVSGQGKSTLCYRYLIDTYPEGCVFCVRSIDDEDHAKNLVAALDGLGKHNGNLIIYIDVQPGQILWAFLLQELQARGLTTPVLVSIRDEDYNLTPISGKTIQCGVIELTLSKDEAEQIFDSYTKTQPHAEHRSFEDAWQVFGGQGPLIEFVYLLTNNQTLTRRLHEQIDALLQAGMADEWLELLTLVCYAGRLGCAINLKDVKREIQCSTIQAAIRRLKDEYLIRVVDENRIEALHPVRAQIVYDELCNQMCVTDSDLTFKALSCIPSQNVRIVLLDYFSHHQYSCQDIHRLSKIEFCDWVGYANVIRSMLWLDAKRYADNNISFISTLVEKRGKGWVCFLPLDLSGIERPGELIADGMKDLSIINAVDLQKAIDEVKNSLVSLTVDYQATDYFVKNSVAPELLPETDADRISFGYALFWMAKRGRNATLSFDVDEVVANVCAGSIQSSADAIRGLSEHSTLSVCYEAAVDVMEKRIIEEMQVLSYSVTDNEVICKFIPPMFSEATSTENVKNVNQHWRIKMLDILKQIYPSKEYINIELIGVDLLRDIGIEAMDYKLNIHKSRRPNSWISELNGWVKTRIDYILRPSTWNEYVAEIDDTRKNIQELVFDTIKLIDDIYKKGHYTKERWKRVEDRLKIFRLHTFAENRLPKFAVDPYCLYSEGNIQSPNTEYYTMLQLLSVGKYERFRKSLNAVYTSLDNFYNQFADVLLARIKKQGIDAVDNPRLAMFNLFSASKELVVFQREYSILFSRYSSLPDTFAREELESILTLVNVWRHVLDHTAQGKAIAYDAKQQYRKGRAYFRETLARAASELDAELVYGEKNAYIIREFSVAGGVTLEEEYESVVLGLRKTFESSILPSSDKWYVETQTLELAYIPSISGICFPIAFSIPFYKLYDVDVSRIAKTMLPCEIESVIVNRISSNSVLNEWINALKTLGQIKLCLQQYQQVLQFSVDQKCNDSLATYVRLLSEQVHKHWIEYVLIKEPVASMMDDVDEYNGELLSFIWAFFDCYDDISELICNQEDLSEIIDVIDKVSAVMILLQSFVTECDI